MADKKVQKEPLKIENKEQFEETCKRFTGLDKEKDIKRQASRIEDYIRRKLIEYTEASGPKQNKTELLEFLMFIEKTVPMKEYFKEQGLDLYTVFFKITYYDMNIEYSVNNIRHDKE